MKIKVTPTIYNDDLRHLGGLCTNSLTVWRDGNEKPEVSGVYQRVLYSVTLFGRTFATIVRYSYFSVERQQWLCNQYTPEDAARECVLLGRLDPNQSAPWRGLACDPEIS